MRRRLAGIVGVWVAACGWAAQSPEDALYPSGAPGPVMKTLNQVEPRTPITSADRVLVKPGAYYLATNLVSYGHGITIQSDHVTLDLMGFSLKGLGGSGYFGIYLVGATNALLRNVVVRNGCVYGFDMGVRADQVKGCRFEQLTVYSNLTYGVLLNGGGGGCQGNTLEACVIGKNRQTGVSLHAQNGRCEANALRDCQITQNGESGVVVNGSGGGLAGGNVIDACVIQGNGSYGVWLNGNGGQCSGNRIEGNVIAGNGSYGVSIGGLSGKCYGNRVERNSICHNTGIGVYLFSAMANEIDGNHVFGTVVSQGGSQTGIGSSSSASNVVVRNSCVGQVLNYSLGANDTYGPAVTNRGALPASGKAMHPWANFSR